MRFLSTICMLLVLPVLASAENARNSDAVLDALYLDRLLEVMESEALISADELADGMIPATAMEGWRRTISKINAPDFLSLKMRADFAVALPLNQIDAIMDFLDSAQGQRIVKLELSAREALLNPEIEDYSLEILDQSSADDSPRLRMARRFASVNDLVDSNVVGALNANAAFLRGMNAGVDTGSVLPMSDAEIVEQVWAQEEEIRRSTEEWVYSFLLLAHQPLSDAELEAYIAFSESSAGQALNQALFEAFDEVFVSTSEQTGEAMAQALASEDI